LPHRGSVHLLVPTHVCPTVNLAERFIMVAPNKEGLYDVESIEEVTARAHGCMLAEAE